MIQLFGLVWYCLQMCVAIIQNAVSLCFMLRYKFTDYNVRSRIFFALSRTNIQSRTEKRLDIGMELKSIWRWTMRQSLCAKQKKNILKENLRTLNEPAIVRDWNRSESNGASLPTLPFVFIVLILRCMHMQTLNPAFYSTLSHSIFLCRSISITVSRSRCLTRKIQTCLW